jgi:hypothetical protein
MIRIPEYTLDQSVAIISDRGELALKEWSYGDAFSFGSDQSFVSFLKRLVLFTHLLDVKVEC